MNFRAYATSAVSAAWSSANAIARMLAQPTRLPCRVVSVGNLQAGGTGKTPFVAEIAREAVARGLEVFILTRGYGGSWERDGGMLAPTFAADPLLTGDEPALLRARVPGAWIGIGADRVASFKRCAKAAHALPDLVLLDDGFQHHRIASDVQIALVTSKKPSEVPYRDFPSALSRADLVVWTKGETPPDSQGRPFARVLLQPKLWGESSLSDRPLWLVTGIADGEQARRSIESASGGQKILQHIALRDHAQYSVEDLKRWSKEAATAGCRLATTGKDWVKWRALGFTPSDVVVFEPEIEWIEGRETWEKILWAR